MERCERAGDEGSVRKCCLSAATACLCLHSESHNTKALVCGDEHTVCEHVCSRVCLCVYICVCHTYPYVTSRCSAGDTVQINQIPGCAFI